MAERQLDGFMNFVAAHGTYIYLFFAWAIDS